MSTQFPIVPLSQFPAELRRAIAPEPFLSPADAAAALGLKYHHIQRAAAAKLLPSYRPFGRRRYVLLSETVAFIQASRQGGQR